MGVAISSAAASTAASFVLSEKSKASVLDYVIQPRGSSNVLENPDSKVSKIKEKSSDLLDMIQVLNDHNIN